MFFLANYFLAPFYSVFEKNKNLAKGIETECETHDKKSEAITSQESEMCNMETSM